MRILVVEDQPEAALVLSRALRERGYAVDVAEDGELACMQAGVTDYDVMILDLMLPKLDGIAVCRQLRLGGQILPILMLTARDEIDARVTGLDAGADDYLVKPFDLRELLARVRALARRGARPPLSDSLTVGDLAFDRKSRQVSVKNQPLRLTSKEYALLEFFASQPGAVITRTQIAESLWDDSYDPFSNVIDVYIRRLRRKLAEASSAATIQTRRREGYRLLPSGEDAR